MKEVCRFQDSVIIGHYRNLLESAGIEVFVRNDAVSVVEPSIPDFFPNICVINDEDFPKAMKILKEARTAENAEPKPEVKCCQCGELNPGTFEICFNCRNPLTPSKPC